MSLKDWENKVLSSPGAAGRVAAIEDELRLAAGLTALREEAGLSQRELAKRIGVSQPRVAAEGSDAGCAAAGLDTVQQHGAPGRAQLLEGAQTGRSRVPDRPSPTLFATRSATRFDLATTASKRKTQHGGFDGTLHAVPSYKSPVAKASRSWARVDRRRMLVRSTDIRRRGPCDGLSPHDAG